MKYRGGITKAIWARMTRRPEPVTCTNPGRRWCPEGDLNSQCATSIEGHLGARECSCRGRITPASERKQHPKASRHAGGSISRSITPAIHLVLPATVLVAASLTTALCAPQASDQQNRLDAYHAAMRAEAGRIVQDQVTEMSRGRHCTTTARLVDGVLVVNATKDRAGNIQHDTGVVREVAFDRALADAEAGRVWILAYCDKVGR